MVAVKTLTPEETQARFAASEFKEAQKKAAIAAGIAAAERNLSSEEWGVVQAHIDLSLDLFTVGVEPLTERELEIITDIAKYTASDPLLCKALVAMFMEQAIHDGHPIVDGPVGRALDKAVEVLRPLNRDRRFYNLEAD